MVTNILLGLLVGFSGLQASDPDAALKEINEWRTAQYDAARSAGKPIDAQAIAEEVKKKAEEAIHDVKPSQVEPAKAYSWMQLFMMAQKYEDIKALCDQFMKSSPDANQTYSAESTCMQAYYSMGKWHEGAMTISMMAPTNMAQAANMMSYAAQGFAPNMVEEGNPDAAIKLLDTVYGKLPEANGDREASQLSGALAAYFEAKAEALIAKKQESEAAALLEKALEDSRIDANAKRGLTNSKIRMMLPGHKAPSIDSERGYGTYNGLDSLKGKVVVVDFFAHWCPPCKAAFPDMRKMYDDLKGQGFEMIGVTRYYGYYEKEQNLSKDDEFARMSGFRDQFKINWPVIYDANSSFSNYGISGIPTAILIDRNGNVRDIHVGYSPESFKEFRQKVEALLKEKS